MLADQVALRSVSVAGDVRTIASQSAIGITAAGVGTLAQMPMDLSGFVGVTVDPAGNVVIADPTAATVRRISPSGVVTLVSGLVQPTRVPLDGVGSAAQLGRVQSVVSDPTGALAVIAGYAVAKIGTDGATNVFTGSPVIFGGVDGNAATARFNNLLGLTRRATGDLFVTANNAVRRIDAAGNVSTYAGAIDQGVSQVDGPVATARFVNPGEIAAAPDGSLYVADGGLLRRVAPDGLSVSTFNAAFGIFRFAIDSAGTVYFGNSSGLSMLDLAGTETLLIAQGPAVVLGNSSPRVSNIDGIAVLGPKQLVIVSGGQILVATLP